MIQTTLDPKVNPFKTILTWGKMLQLGRSSMICVVTRSRQTMRTKKKHKTKIDCHVMHLKNSTKSKRESRKKNVEKMMKKLHKHKSFFSCKESLFSLGNYVWDEKWPSFIIPSLIEKLSIVTPFEPDNFSFNNPTKDHSLH